LYNCKYTLLGPDPEKMARCTKNDLGRIWTLQSNRPIHKTYKRLLTLCWILVESLRLHRH